MCRKTSCFSYVSVKKGVSKMSIQKEKNVQNQILIKEKIISYIEEHGYAPTVREICEMTNLKSTSSVQSYLCKMFEAGEIETDAKIGSSRAIRIPGYKFVKVNPILQDSNDKKNDNQGNRANFVLPEKVLEESDIKCPKCSACMKKGNTFFKCECGYKIPHLIATKHLNDDEVRQLIRGKTGIIKGFKRKNGKRFDAILVADQNGIVTFDFQKK